jgi:cytoskeleton protein RodZ
LRAYAEYLGLDGGLFVERLKTEIAGRSDSREGTVQVNSPRERKLPPGGIALAVLLLIALIYGAYYLFVAVNRMTAQPVTPVPARLAEQAGLSAPPSPSSTPPQPSDAALAAASPVSGGAATIVPSVNGAPAVPTAAAPLAAAPSSTAAAVPQGHKYGTENVGSRIMIVAHRPTRILVQGRNNLLLMDRQFQAGDSYLVPNMVGVMLSSPDGGALELVLDGASMGYAGKDGVASDGLSLNPQDIVDRQRHG